MNIPPIQLNKPQPTFGIYKVSKVTHYGHRDTCLFKDYKLDIYTAKDNGELKHKLYYLSDRFGNWIKSKLIIYENNNKKQVIKSQNDKLDFTSGSKFIG